MLLCSLMLSLPVQTATSLLLLIAQKYIIEHILNDTVDLTKISLIKSVSLNMSIKQLVNNITRH